MPNPIFLRYFKYSSDSLTDSHAVGPVLTSNRDRSVDHFYILDDF